MLPAVRSGAAKAGRQLDRFQACMKPLVATAVNETELAPKVRDARARIAFYASTPQYRAAFDHLGLGDLADRLKLLSRAQRWEEMPQHISDDVLHTFVTIATYDTIGRKLCDRYGDVVTTCEFSIAVKNDADRERLHRLPATSSPKVSRAPGVPFSESRPDSDSSAPSTGENRHETRTPWRMVRHR
jgi:hypothetical protein